MEYMDSPDPSERQQTNEKKDDRYFAFLRHHIDEIKQLVIENGKLSVKNEDLEEEKKELKKELEHEKMKSNGVRVKKYLNVILTLVLIGQIATIVF